MKDLTLEEVLERLTKITGYKPRRAGGEGWYVGRCPIHADSSPSLGVIQNDGFVGLHCFAGCDYRDIVDAIQEQRCSYNPNDLEGGRSNHKSKIPPWERPIKVEYNYYDDLGNLVMQKVRFADAEKEFGMRRPHDQVHGWWYWNIRGLEIPLYNIHKIKKSSVIAFVEGEKDADNLTTIGLPATCTVWGASKGKLKWFDSYNKYFYAKHVLIFADNDEVGIEHAKMVLEKIPTFSVRSKTLMHPLPGLSYKMDVSDWLQLGNNIDDILELWHERSGFSLEYLKSIQF